MRNISYRLVSMPSGSEESFTIRWNERVYSNPDEGLDAFFGEIFPLYPGLEPGPEWLEFLRHCSSFAHQNGIDRILFHFGCDLLTALKLRVDPANAVELVHLKLDLFRLQLLYALWRFEITSRPLSPGDLAFLKYVGKTITETPAVHVTPITFPPERVIYAPPLAQVVAKYRRLLEEMGIKLP